MRLVFLEGPIVSDDTDGCVFILIGRAWRAPIEQGGEPSPVNVVLCAADDDDAVRKTLEALAENGFAEAELDRIGVLTEEPEEAVFEQAYQDALSGDVAIISFSD